TLEASSGREALAVVASRRPDLILLDVAMPELDGLGFLKVLRSNIQYQDIPVILLTAVAERDYVLQAAQLGARDYLLKSHFSLAELLDRVARRLQPEAAVSAAAALPSGK